MRASGGRIVELDALRGFAALAVVAFHYTTRYEELFGRETALTWNASWGHYGVDLFFMLSGFVIFMTLDRTEGWVKFLWGRFSRLYPVYWVAVGITFTIVALCGLPGQEVSFRDALLNLTMIQSLLGAEHVDGAYWSLQAEVIFYVNMIILYQAGAFRRPFLAVVCWVALSAVAQGLMAASAAGIMPAASLVSKLATIASLKYIPLFGIGILFYLGRAGRIDGWQSSLGAAFCMTAIGIYQGLAVAAVSAGLAGTLFLAVDGRLSWLKSSKLAYLGVLSYPLYLTHQNMGYVVMRQGEAIGMGPNLSLGMALLFAVLLAVGLHHLVERPALLRLRSWGIGRIAAVSAFRKSLALSDARQAE